MTVKELKEILSKSISKLENFDNNDEIVIKTNTYFLDNCRYFLGVSSEGYVNLDKLEVERAQYVTLHDVDLCISDDGDGAMSFDELHKMCIEHCVTVKLEEEHSESGWPSFCFDGLAKNVADVLEKLGFDEEQIDDMIEEALE